MLGFIPKLSLTNIIISTNKKDLFTGYTQTDFDLAYNEGLRVGNSGKFKINFLIMVLTLIILYRSLNFKSYYQTY